MNRQSSQVVVTTRITMDLVVGKEKTKIALDAVGAMDNLNRFIVFLVEAMEVVEICTADMVLLEAMEANTLIVEGDLVACTLRTMKIAMGTEMDEIDPDRLLRTDILGKDTTTDHPPKTGLAPRLRHPAVAAVV